MSQPSVDPRALEQYVTASEPWLRASLKTLVEHPTVSPGGGHEADIRRGAEAARDLIRALGGTAELIATDGTPAVWGGFTPPGARAALIVYNHLDVQPADLATWTRGEPFRFAVEPDQERGFLYCGRGATDDKGPALAALRAAAFAAEHGIPLAVRFLWETEEEIGSPHFAAVVNRIQAGGHGGDLDAGPAPNAVIVSDSIWPSAAVPAMSTGLRGGLNGIFRLRTAAKEAHSGLTGGVARNPVRELCLLAAAIHGARFWHEGAIPPAPAELAGFAASGFDPAYFKRSFGLEKIETEVPLEMMLRTWARPTFELHGLTGGYTGPGVKTAVPKEAELKWSFRLVHGQDPADLEPRLRAFVAAVNPDVEIEITSRLAPYMSGLGGPAADAVRAGMTRAFGQEPVPVREGGSIGAVSIMTEMLGLPVAFLPLSLPEHGYHAPDEYFDWRQAAGGISAFVHAFAAYAAAATT
jgi:acetylornithine deacetylase/succinyl-diaminopimelate desuccinylase-like protein